MSTPMDTDCSNNGVMDSKLTPDLSEEFLEDFCKKAATSFFREYGLVSHQINSYNDFIKNGIHNVFDSLGEINVQPAPHDPSGSETVRRYATVKFDKVTLERPMFRADECFSTESGKEYLVLLPKHARLQNITYSARISVQMHLQVSRPLYFPLFIGFCAFVLRGLIVCPMLWLVIIVMFIKF